MDQVTLQAQGRTEVGSRPARRLRRDGLIPAIVYGRDQETLSLVVTDRDLFGALHTDAGVNALINLEYDGGALLTVAREIQRDPVRGDVTHLDFITVSLDEVIQADVNIELIGIPVGVTEDEGVVETIEATVSIRALPAEIPQSLELDISALHVGDTLTIGDLADIEGVEYVDDAERPVVTVLAPRKIEEVVAEDEELEGELGEEGEEGEEGAEPTEDGDAPDEDE